jgi:hypothetical protein
MTGLIGWWPLHEQSGQANDLSGNGNHGTVNGATQGVAGKEGLTAYNQSGSEYIKFPGDPLSGYENMTFTFWFKWDGTFESHLFRCRPTQANLFDFQSGGQPEPQLNNVITDSNGTTHSIGNTISNLPQVSKNKWVFGVVRYRKNKDFSLYLDGELINSIEVDNYRVKSFTNDIYTKNNGYGQEFGGNISEIRTYNRALSPQEIQTLYEWGSGDYTDRSYHDGSDTGAVSRWKLDGDVTDSWSSNDGTNNGVTFVDGVKGRASEFNADESDYIDIGNSIDASAGIAHSIWVKTNSASSGSQMQFFDHGWGAYETNDYIRLLWDTSESEVDLTVRGADTSDNTTRLSAKHSHDEWMHYLSVLTSGGDLHLFQNGHLVSSDKSTFSDSSEFTETKGNIWLGASYSTASNWYLDGLIDDFRIYNRALQPNEVFQLYQWGTRGRDMRKLTTNARGDQ